MHGGREGVREGGREGGREGEGGERREGGWERIFCFESITEEGSSC